MNVLKNFVYMQEIGQPLFLNHRTEGFLSGYQFKSLAVFETGWHEAIQLFCVPYQSKYS